MYTVCYVLIDSEQLSYFNEMMISIVSLRYNGYSGKILVVTDYETRQYVAKSNEDLIKHSVDIKVVDVPSNYNPKEKSRFIKTSLRSYLIGDYLYVDTDTIFANKLSDSISDYDIAMVTDHHYEKLAFNTPTYNFALPRSQKSGVKLILGYPYYNSGVIWVKDTENTRLLYKNWHEAWKDSCRKGVSEDQLCLNAVNHRLGRIISHLDDAYNVQVSDGETIPFTLLREGIIIHYFQCHTEYMLSNPEIRASHYESEMIQRIITSPKTAFIDGKIITSEEFFEMNRITCTLQYRLLKKICEHKRIFAFNERILRYVFRLRNLFRRLL